MSESILRKDSLGKDIDAYEKWLEYQMTAQMIFSNLEINHV